jgi:phosphoglycolate phosphatase-like HAD superfamily hydrolase
MSTRHRRLVASAHAYCAHVTAPTRPLAVFDVDGVLADVRHRLRHVERRPKDWDAFFSAAVDDPPLPEGVRLARASAQDCEVVYVTGRPERCRADTLDWFRRHGLPAGTLAMRRAGDRRPARVAKPELLRRLARGRAVAVVVVDDPAVCDAYEQAGWRVLRATWMTAPGHQQEQLFAAQELEGRT